jgi:hypothetical protein
MGRTIPAFDGYNASRMKSLPCLVILLFGTAAVASPPRPLSGGEQAVVNFGFATQLGSGIYSLSGRTLQVYRLPFGYALPHEDGARLRARLTFPFTIGFVDFKPVDVVDTGLPENLDSFSFVPGVEFDYALTDRWGLQPFAEAGIARDRNSEVDQRVYSLGLRTRYDVERGAVDWQAYGEAVRVVVDQASFDQTDDFTRVRGGLSARRPFATGRPGRRADYLVYGFVELFTDAPAGPAGETRDRDGLQYEAGFTLGATETVRIWRIPLPRVGFGYRFGDGVTVYRIVLGSPY